MKKHLILIVLFPFFLACSDGGFNNNNPYLPNYTFTETINLNLPAYSSLQFPANAIYYQGATARGIYIFCTGPGNYNAFDAGCPNQALSSCSILTLKVTNVVCPCDNEEYSLFTGLSQGGLQYPLKQYRVEVNGNLLRVYN
jgi:nitrite reductase/ring-hydroxylating ferredoxin subunit